MIIGFFDLFEIQQFKFNIFIANHLFSVT